MNNHDNSRWLANWPGQYAGFKSAVVFAMTARGIPFFYYGDEQYFHGGNDPANRESLWNAMNTSSDMYLYIAKINKARKAAEVWNHPYQERWVTDHFFAYSHGDMLVMTTNSSATQDMTITNIPWASGTEVCNIFWPNDDCQTISNGSMSVHLQSGEAKIWLPKTSSYFTNSALQFLQ